MVPPCPLPRSRGRAEATGGRRNAATVIRRSDRVREVSTQRFRVALLYPGERRPFVALVAEALAAPARAGAGAYDKLFEAEIRPGHSSSILSATWGRLLPQPTSELGGGLSPQNIEKENGCVPPSSGASSAPCSWSAARRR